MIRGVLGSRASIGGVLGSGRGGAAALWWLSGGVSAANCVAAYTPKGAASLAASYDNNAAPGNGLADGTYDAAPGVAPTFDTATGWTLGGTQYLTTGIVPAIDQTWSMIARFSDGLSSSTRFVAGLISAADFRFWLMSGSSRNYGNGESINVATATTAGVLCVAGKQGYNNGSADGGTITTVTRANALGVFIGTRNTFGSPGSYFTGKIQALAIYNVTLSAPQVAAISAAMAAL